MVSIMNTKFREGKERQGLRDVLFPHILVLFHGRQMGSRGERIYKVRTFELFFSHGGAVVKVEEGRIEGFGGRLILWVVVRLDWDVRWEGKNEFVRGRT